MFVYNIMLKYKHLVTCYSNVLVKYILTDKCSPCTNIDRLTYIKREHSNFSFVRRRSVLKWCIPSCGNLMSRFTTVAALGELMDGWVDTPGCLDT